ncbi:RNA 2',3'-cyclic phosphodiesterase [Aestuariibacter sp. A3R04]|uniref:RNA 2',3'-cyclic phosphodiesterase n=1 Tax=Aestuariibacter sp. A3R04 TaxID=2841571 RepID=UPI001C080F2B|nr:RNA 2',3'-cyclic phosphodiesterase [Aestuariibacter sp. A3R04]MBU3020756.1 RNA 2',3'-cyclic phosphodiesterase [Aestuariibacter sp. A3R04]
MRSFIGLDLSIAEKLSLERWRENALPDIPSKSKRGIASGAYAIPAANFHITLAFLGNITPRQHNALIPALDAISAPPFALTLDSTGYWHGPKIIFAAPSSPNQAIAQLAGEVKKAARRATIPIDNKAYQPHVTLVRKASSFTPPPLFMPSITVKANAFHLFESRSTPSGVQYPIRASWTLNPNLTVREQLKQGLL